MPPRHPGSRRCCLRRLGVPEASEEGAAAPSTRRLSPWTVASGIREVTCVKVDRFVSLDGGCPEGTCTDREGLDVAEVRRRFIHRHRRQRAWPGLWFTGPGLYHNASKSIDSKTVLPNHGTWSPLRPRRLSGAVASDSAPVGWGRGLGGCVSASRAEDAVGGRRVREPLAR